MKASGGVIFLDVIFTGGLGCIVDGATKKWRIVRNRHVDVENVLAGQPQRGQGKLKRMIRKADK